MYFSQECVLYLIPDVHVNKSKEKDVLYKKNVLKIPMNWVWKKM